MREDLKTTHSSLQIYQYISWPQVIRESHERSLMLSGLVFVWDYVEQNLDWLICNPMFFYFKFFRSFVSRNLKGRPYIIRAPDLRGQAQKRGEWDELLYLAQELAQDTWLLAQLQVHRNLPFTIHWRQWLAGKDTQNLVSFKLYEFHKNWLIDALLSNKQLIGSQFSIVLLNTLLVTTDLPSASREIHVILTLPHVKYKYLYRLFHLHANTCY